MLTWDDNIDAFKRDVARAQREVSDSLRNGVRMACEEGARTARIEHRYKDRSNDLTDSIDGYVITSAPGGAEGVIEATAPHASFVEAGTEPHEIRPRAYQPISGPVQEGKRRGRRKGKKALRFEVGGEEVFARVVHHPGSKPYPFMGPAAQKAERVLQREVELGVERAKRILEGG